MRKWIPDWAVSLLCGVISLACLQSRAEAQDTQVGVDAQEDRADAAIRIQEELRTMGLRTVLVDPLAPNSHSLLGLIHLPAHGEDIEVWILDRKTNQLHQVDVVQPLGVTETDRRAAYWRAAEVLRALLIRTGLVSESAKPVAQPAKAITPIPNPTAQALVPRPTAAGASAARPFVPRWSAQAALGLMKSGDLSSAWMVEFGERWQPASRLGLHGWMGLPLQAASLTAEEGSAKLAPLVVALGAYTPLLPRPDSWFAPYAELGMGVAVLSMRGEAAPLYHGREIRRMRLAPYGELGARLRLTRQLHVSAGAGLVSLPTESAILFENREVGKWGRWVVHGVAGIELLTL